MEKTVGQMVAEDYRTAQVFKNHKIDFCCKGNRTLQVVADKNGLDKDSLLKELVEVQNKNQVDDPDFNIWPLDLLIDYIEKKTPSLCGGTDPHFKTISQQTMPRTWEQTP